MMFERGRRVYNRAEEDRGDTGEVLDSYRDSNLPGVELVKVKWDSERYIPGSVFTRPEEEWVMSSRLGLLLPEEK